MWGLADGKRKVGQILDMIRKAHGNISEDRLRDDVIGFFSRLSQLGFVTLNPPKAELGS